MQARIALDENPPQPSTTSMIVPREGAVTQEKLDDLTRRINAIYRRGTLDVVCAVGELVIHELYEGNVETWGRDGTRRTSYRKLSSRGDLLLSPSALCRAVAVYILCKRLGGRANWRNLTASHLQEVL